MNRTNVISQQTFYQNRYLPLPNPGGMFKAAGLNPDDIFISATPKPGGICKAPEEIFSALHKETENIATKRNVADFGKTSNFNI